MNFSGAGSMAVLEVGSYHCFCRDTRHQPKLIVLTGGPEAGKTAVLEMARKVFCPHVAILPDAVIHMETPAADGGYNNQNPIRVECAVEARIINGRILEVWKNHPRRLIVSSTTNFPDKAVAAVKCIASELPACCHDRPSELVGQRSRELSNDA